MGTSKALIKSLEELVAGGTKIHFFDSNDGYEVTVDTTFAKELIQKYHLHETNTAPWRIGKNFFTYVNMNGMEMTQERIMTISDTMLIGFKLLKLKMSVA